MFPPRYAGMEGLTPNGADADPSFPRATRGWKGTGETYVRRSAVSPALRGDGRTSHGLEARRPWFPPRYAGMEGARALVTSPIGCFPRATRGWKTMPLNTTLPSVVSPALRGDGSGGAATARPRAEFPPRYAGMEGDRRCGLPPSRCFPRATRGWKGGGPVDVLLRWVSPALRGDGSRYLSRRERQNQFPPRYAGMEGYACHRFHASRCFPRASRGW